MIAILLRAARSHVCRLSLRSRAGIPNCPSNGPSSPWDPVGRTLGTRDSLRSSLCCSSEWRRASSAAGSTNLPQSLPSFSKLLLWTALLAQLAHGACTSTAHGDVASATACNSASAPPVAAIPAPGAERSMPWHQPNHDHLARAAAGIVLVGLLLFLWTPCRPRILPTTLVYALRTRTRVQFEGRVRGQKRGLNAHAGCPTLPCNLHWCAHYGQRVPSSPQCFLSCRILRFTCLSFLFTFG